MGDGQPVFVVARECSDGGQISTMMICGKTTTDRTTTLGTCYTPHSGTTTTLGTSYTPHSGTTTTLLINDHTTTTPQSDTTTTPMQCGRTTIPVISGRNTTRHLAMLPETSGQFVVETVKSDKLVTKGQTTSSPSFYTTVMSVISCLILITSSINVTAAVHFSQEYGKNEVLQDIVGYNPQDYGNILS